MHCRILVVGDVMLDRYFYGEVTRISPEAPVPVTLIKNKKNTLGGAANVAHNLARLGCQVSIAGVIGDDHHGRLLKQQMRNLGISVNGMVLGRENTTTKARILGGHQQMLRMDFEESEPITKEIEQQLMACIMAQIKGGVDAVILSDYHKGVCTSAICQNVIREAHQHGCLVFVDPKGRDWERYAGADYVTPNVKEVSEVIGKSLKNEENELREAAQIIQDAYGIKNVIITRSEKGISLFLTDGEIHIPTIAQEVFDVSGAGDTVISVLAAGLSVGMRSYDVAVMANMAAGIGVGKVGTYAVRNEEILRCIYHVEKI